MSLSTKLRKQQRRRQNQGDREPDFLRNLFKDPVLAAYKVILTSTQ